MFITLLILAKTLYYISRLLNIGSGFTWPGHLVLYFYPDFVKNYSEKFRNGLILVSGTNGKTTTTAAIAAVLRSFNFRVATNVSGANLLNGLASAMVKYLDIKGGLKADIGVFEVDEAALPNILKDVPARFVILLNLFRDQLDRYGEVDTLVYRWREAFKKLPPSTAIIINANDPALSFLGGDLKNNVTYFGFKDERFNLGSIPHHADSSFCLFCNSSLIYKVCYFSHIGDWSCPGCGRGMPQVSFEAKNLTLGKDSMSFAVNEIDLKTKLTGLYNVYNFAAIISLSYCLGLNYSKVVKALEEFAPQFGRQETFTVRGRTVRILLSKNPTGFNENLRLLKLITERRDRLLMVLNDNLADGRDVSWVYDVNFENYPELFDDSVYISGRRAFDLALRLKYSNLSKNLLISRKLKGAVEDSLSDTAKGKTLFVLATYTAMLEVRQNILGRRID